MEDVDADLLAEVAEFLEPFEEATKDLESDQTPTLFKAVLWFCKLRKLLASQTGSEVRQCLNARAFRFLQQKFSTGIYHKVAVFLCPMFKKLSVFPEESRSQVLSAVRQFISDFPEPPELPTSSCTVRPGDKRTMESQAKSDHAYVPVAKRANRFAEFEDHDETIDERDDEVAVYMMTNFSYPAEQSFDPLMFWRDNSKQFPKLAHVARGVFSCPASSSASERAFSLAGFIYSKRRGGHMNSSTLEALSFLHSLKKAESKS